MSAGALSRRRALGAAGGALTGGAMTPLAGGLPFGSGDDGLIAICRRIDEIENAVVAVYAKAAASMISQRAAHEEAAPLVDERWRLIEVVCGIRARTLAGLKARVQTLMRWAPDLLDCLSDADGRMLAAVFDDILGEEMT